MKNVKKVKMLTWKTFQKVDLSTKNVFFQYFWDWNEVPYNIYTETRGNVSYISMGFDNGEVEYASCWEITKMGDLYIISYLGDHCEMRAKVSQGYEHLWVFEKGGELLSEIKGEKLRKRLPYWRCFRK